MQLGIFAKTFDGKHPSIVFPQVKAAGFTVAQYNMACSGLAAMPDEISDAVIADIKSATRSSGVTLNALSATYNMIHPDVSEREKGHRRLAVIAQAAQAFGIPLITLCTGTRDATDQWKHHPDNTSVEAWRDLIQSMQTAITITGKYNVNLGIEPELANVINSAAKAPHGTTPHHLISTRTSVRRCRHGSRKRSHHLGRIRSSRNRRSRLSTLLFRTEKLRL
jgi:sugar phosphate isomerase/epimerase